MTDKPRTFKLDPPMHGDDIEHAQREVVAEFAKMGIEYPLKADGHYGIATKSAYTSLRKSLGMTASVMTRGVNPALRSRIRHRDLTPAERTRMNSGALVAYRRHLRDAHHGGGTASPLTRIVEHSNGFSSGHDGVDLICPADSHGYALVHAKVVRVSDSWWGIANPGGALGDRGDGIVILQSLVDTGPIKKGDYFGYGHAEHPRVHVGETVEPGEWICNAGFANAWHFHFMWFRGNPGTAGDGGPKGIGNRDPWPAVKYCADHAHA